MNAFQSLMKTLFATGVTTVSAEDAKQRLNNSKPPFVLDVRQPAEFKAGHIANAKLIPLDQLGARMNELPKDREILCVCRSGGRSGMAARQLVGAGYTVLNLNGGLTSWEHAGYPTQKGK
jgi:rhodanese-related sulfurtransferase